MAMNTKLLENLFAIHYSQRSGVLRIERGAAKKQFVVKNGLMSFAESNLPGEHLARIMVAAGHLSKNEINKIASMMKTGKTSEEAVFLAVNSNSEILAQGRHEQAILILASMLGWNSCDIHFYSGENLIRHRLILGLALPELLVLSARRAVSDRMIIVPPNFLDSMISIPESSDAERAILPLDRTESYAHSLLRKKTTAADILPLIPSGETPPEEILKRLYILGLFKLEGPRKGKFGTSLTEGRLDSSVQEKLEEMLIRFESANLYEILSVQPDATLEKIKSAYYRLAREFHPDRFQSEDFSNVTRGTAEQVFAYINEAFNTLGNPAFRASYDEKRLIKESEVEATLKARSAAGAEEEKMAEVLFREGRISFSNGDFEKAVDQLKECVWLRPDKAKYHHYLGVAQSEIPKLRKKAEQHLLKAIELDAMSIDSHFELAKLYLKVMLPRKAEVQLQKAVSLDPENPKAQLLCDELARFDSSRTGVFDRTKNLFSRR